MYNEIALWIGSYKITAILWCGLETHLLFKLYKKKELITSPFFYYLQV